MVMLKINWGEILQTAEQQCVQSSDSLDNLVNQPNNKFLRSEPLSSDVWYNFNCSAESSNLKKKKKSLTPQLLSDK